MESISDFKIEICSIKVIDKFETLNTFFLDMFYQRNHKTLHTFFIFTINC